MEIVLHLGAHKTASTYIQKRLARSTKRLSKHDVRVLGPKALRPLMTEAGQALSDTSARAQSRLRREVVARVIAEAEADGIKRLILSEEHFMGALRHTIEDGTFYANLIAQFAPVVAACGIRPVTVMMAVRNHADYFISTYGQFLRGQRYIPFDDTLRQRLLDMHGGWAEVADDILALLPGGSMLRIWRYELFEQLESAVLDELVGKEAARDVRGFTERPLPGPSHEAICVLDRIAKNGPPSVDQIRMVLEEACKSRGYRAFDPWTPEERRRLDARYHADLRKISRMKMCSWLGEAPIRIAA